MAEQERERPTTNQPVHGPRRRLAPALLAVLGLVVAIVVVLLVITWARYST